MAQCKICGTGEAQIELRGELARICTSCIDKYIKIEEVKHGHSRKITEKES